MGEHDPPCQALLLRAKLPEQGRYGGLYGSTLQKLLRKSWAAWAHTFPEVAWVQQQITVAALQQAPSGGRGGAGGRGDAKGGRGAGRGDRWALL